MIKVFFKYFLCASIFLLSWQNFLHAGTNGNMVSSAKNLKSLEHTHFCTLQNKLTPLVSFLSSSKAAESCNINAVLVYDNNDEDELICFKKQLKSSNCFSFIFMDKTETSFNSINTKNIPFPNLISRTLSNRYITYRAFRI